MEKSKTVDECLFENFKVNCIEMFCRLMRNHNILEGNKKGEKKKNTYFKNTVALEYMSNNKI